MRNGITFESEATYEGQAQLPGVHVRCSETQQEMYHETACETFMSRHSRDTESTAVLQEAIQRSSPDAQKTSGLCLVAACPTHGLRHRSSSELAPSADTGPYRGDDGGWRCRLSSHAAPRRSRCAADNMRRQVVDADHVALALHECKLQRVLQFADIAGPFIGKNSIQRCRRQR